MQNFIFVLGPVIEDAQESILSDVEEERTK